MCILTVLAKNVNLKCSARLYSSKEAVSVNLQGSKLEMLLSLLGVQAYTKDELILALLTTPKVKLYYNQTFYRISVLKDVG